MSEPKRYDSWGVTPLYWDATGRTETDAPAGESLVLATDYDRLREHAEALAASVDVLTDNISTFRMWFEDDYTRFVDLPEDDPLLEETAKLGLIGRAESVLDAYRKETE